MGFSTIGGAAGGGAPETPAGDGTSQVAFKTVSVSGQSDVVADGAEDTLTLAAGSNVTITTNAGTDTVTIASSGGGSALSGIDDQSSSLDDCITILDAEVVINEDGDDQNFRVETDNNTNFFFVDAGKNAAAFGCEPVEAGSGAPNTMLQISARATASTPSGYAPLVVENDASAAYINIISNNETSSSAWKGFSLGISQTPTKRRSGTTARTRKCFLAGTPTPGVLLSLLLTTTIMESGST